MRPTKIGIDIDGVLANFTTAFTQLMRDITGRDTPVLIDKEDIKSWDFTFLGFTDEELAKGWLKVRESDFWLNLKPIDPNFTEKIQKFQSSFDVDMYYITARVYGINHNIKQDTEWWLYEHGINFPTVINSTKKGDLCQSIPIDFYIDDNLNNIVECDMIKRVRRTNDTELYLYDYPYNRKPPEGISPTFQEDIQRAIDRTNRVNDLDEFLTDVGKKIDAIKTG